MGNKSSKKTEKIPPPGEQELKEAFSAFDTDGSGKITVEEFKQLINKFEGEVSDSVAQAFIEAADKSGDGKVNFKEFKTLWNLMRGEDDAELVRIRNAFEFLDLDANGGADKEEIGAVIRGEIKDEEEREKAIAIYNALDVDGDGRVSYPEFMINWKFNPSRQVENVKLGED